MSLSKSNLLNNFVREVFHNLRAVANKSISINLQPSFRNSKLSYIGSPPHVKFTILVNRCIMVTATLYFNLFKKSFNYLRLSIADTVSMT